MLNAPFGHTGEAWRAVGQACGGVGPLRLAVSGGPDSLAMLVGFAALRDAGLLDARLEVVSVDHGLRAQSAHEAAMVADVAAQLGVAGHVVRLRVPDDIKNRQAWARTERYKALAATGDLINPTVLTAHTADDQAETILMRAARGAGSEGLAGIRSPITLAGARIERPFLAWRRADLVAILDGTPWKPAHDPSNVDEAYTRVRFRNWLAQAPTPDSARSVVVGLAETARLVDQESVALDHYANQLIDHIGGAGRGFVDGSLPFAHTPRAVQSRLLRLVLMMVARPGADSLDLARMDALAAHMMQERAGRWVGGGAVLDWKQTGEELHLAAFAEAGRMGFPTIEVGPGQTAIWDGRFAVNNARDSVITVRAWARGDPVPANTVSKAMLGSLPVAERDGEVLACFGCEKEPAVFVALDRMVARS